jgi:hypothetical protein
MTTEREMKLYIVQYWNDDDSRPMGVFSTQEKADEFVAEMDSIVKHGMIDVEEIELDVPFCSPNEYGPNE